MLTKDVELIYDFGMNIGIAFQIHDDILDAYAGCIFWKTKGRDIIEEKNIHIF